MIYDPTSDVKKRRLLTHWDLNTSEFVFLTREFLGHFKVEYAVAFVYTNFIGLKLNSTYKIVIIGKLYTWKYHSETVETDDSVALLKINLMLKRQGYDAQISIVTCSVGLSDARI